MMDFNKLIKIILASLAINIAQICLADYTAANRIFKNPDNKCYWGARMSFTRYFPHLWITDHKYNKAESYDLFSPGNGGSVGGIFHLPLLGNLYLEPGLSFTHNKFNIKRGTYIGEIKELLENGGELKQSSVVFNSLKLPVVIGFHFDFFKDFNLAVFQGPILNYIINMDTKIKIEKDGKFHSTNVSLFKPLEYNDDYIRRFNVQWRFGASLNYRQYMIGVNIDGEISNLYKTSDYNKQYYKGDFNTWELFLSIGYNFK